MTINMYITTNAFERLDKMFNALLPNIEFATNKDKNVTSDQKITSTALRES